MESQILCSEKSVKVKIAKLSSGGSGSHDAFIIMTVFLHISPGFYCSFSECILKVAVAILVSMS